MKNIKGAVILFVLFFCAQILDAQVNVTTGSVHQEALSPGETGTISVTFNIPQGMHQSLHEDYFYIEAEKIDGFEFFPVQYPKGIEHDGTIEYYDSVTLSMNFIVTDNVTVGEHTIKLYAGYQFCEDEGLCHFPEEEELLLSLNIIGGASRKSSSSLSKYILLALFSDLIINISPCLLPVLYQKYM